MRLGGRQSRNIEDRRGGGGRIAIGGGLGGIVLVVLALLFGVDPSVLLQQGGAPQPQVTERARPGPDRQAQGPEDAGRRFASQVLGETEAVWGEIFARAGRRYEEPVLVLFSGVADSGCGTAQATVGPFYCPLDRRVYIDLDFLADMQRRLGAPGDFAAAYVIAHEVGHHVQNLLGVMDRLEQVRRSADQAQANAALVRVELQADCFAGLWARRAHDARAILESGDVEEGLAAAAAVGDDRLQRRSRGYVVPESFTHGTSEQRVRWFRRGLESGEPSSCDTLGAERL